MIVIGINGQFRHGKTTLAELVAQAARQWGLSAQVVSFAYNLKKIATEQFGWDGEKDKKGRKLLQVLGTEAGRAYDDTIWVSKWFDHVVSLTGSVDVVLTDDMRFPNEALAVRELAGLTVKINRIDDAGDAYVEPGFESLYSHASEGGVECEETYSVVSGDMDAMTLAAFRILKSAR